MKYVKNVKKLPVADKYFIFSDTHFGVGDGADDSAHNQHIVFQLLKKCLDEKTHVIALGDLFDLAENKNIEDIKNQHDDIMWVLGELDNQGLFTYVKGNHDGFIKEKDVEFRTHQYNGDIVPFLSSGIYDGVEIGNFLLVHGHQYKWSYNHKITNWFINWTLRVGWHWLQNIMCKDPSTDQQGWQAASDTDKKLQAMGEKDGKIIVAGHTHKCKILPGYFNVGSFAVLPRTVTYGILDHGTMELRKCRQMVDKDNYVKIIDEPIFSSSKE